MIQNSLKVCMVAFVAVGIVASVGCKDPEGAKTAKKEKKATDTGIFNQRTSEVGEFDKDGDAKVSDGQMRPTNPLNPLGSLNAYGPAAEKIAKLGIDYQLKLFHALHDRYPDSHEEFMAEIIEANGVELPVLPGGKQYQYDVENHKLLIVEAPKE